MISTVMKSEQQIDTRSMPSDSSRIYTAIPTLAERVQNAHKCTPEVARAIVKSGLRSKRQKLLGFIARPWTSQHVVRFNEMAQDISECRSRKEVQDTIGYWRQRSPGSGMLGGIYRVRASRALTLFQKYCEPEVVGS